MASKVPVSPPRSFIEKRRKGRKEGQERGKEGRVKGRREGVGQKEML